ncbi:MAG: glycine--tRNA ligase subunit beta [Anaerolineae bacterium]|nr:glycine--tRNA ligase subunit beta [Anaerolineae bacterium]
MTGETSLLTQHHFQQVIMKLHEFWAAHGCLLWQPYNIQVGAGTGNPATLLRVLGPEPWRVAYVEPSVRPDDGRYGENPNRMQAYYQYQVILKPDPGNPQELYLQSLEAVGIDLRKHDVRFVEDNWKSPALGAWGLGWEVWLDGQEISQFTYFQQAGGLKLDPVSVEITYGLERIVQPLQGKTAVWDIQWTDDILYKDVFFQGEVEHSKYYFEIADVDALKKVYDTYEHEHQRTLEAGLVIPAYDYVLKCSHLFNVLDTRGAIGVTERAAYFRRMAGMTRNVAKAFAEQRQRLEYPMMDNGKSWTYAVPPRSGLPTGEPSAVPADFVLEIGTEELPAGDLDNALTQMREAAPKLFSDLRLTHEGVEVHGTPRRLVVYAKSVAPRQPDEEKLIKGPPANRAFDSMGVPTAAAEGFAKKQGISVHDLKVHDIDGGQFAAAMVKSIGKPAHVVLKEALPAFVAGIKFIDTMRWNSTGIAFSRPIRWLVSLLGSTAIPFEYAGILSDRVTRGTRPMNSPDFSLTDAAAYFKAMSDNGIILSVEERRQAIWEQVQKLAAEVKGTAWRDDELVAEVANLVEQPTPLRGAFEQRFLSLPREVLIKVMASKQRYFAVEDGKGGLLPYFIAVRNGDAVHLDEVIKGNEHVLTARFSDAHFFYTDDRKHKLAERTDRLKTMTFQEKLGSLYDKNQRLLAYVEPLGGLLSADAATLSAAKQAAQIAKADQATRMVVEMTSLEGIMGREYAKLEGQPADVAQAIFEHYLPRSAGDMLPTSPAGVLLSLADRLDSLVGLFAVDLMPTASADPFALRRAALGVVQVLIAAKCDIDLRQAIEIVASKLPIPVSEARKADVLTFIAGRLKVLLMDEYKLPFDAVDAVLAEQAFNPYRALIGAQELVAWIQRPDWSKVLDSFARCVRITRDKPAYTVNTATLSPNEAVELYKAAQAAHGKLTPADNVNAFLVAFEPMIPAVSTFFDKVLVMDSDPAVRENRLALLQYVASLAKGRADLSNLSGF